VAKKTSFYEQPLDRTPYSACAWVGLITAATFIAGTWGLLHLIKLIPQHISLPATPTLQADITAPNVGDKVQQEIDKQKAAAASAAADAAKKAAEQAVQNQVDQGKNQVEDLLRK